MTKNIIFDLGGVILNLDFQRTTDAFYKLGITNINEIFSGYAQYEFFDAFEKGLISPQQFRDEIKKYIPEPVTDNIIDEAWNAMLLDFPAERINLLLSCRSKYRTFLLSNTNELHFSAYNKLLSEKYHIKDFSDLFERVYYSFRLGLRKPEKEIFELVLKENKLKPEETLFIDDSPQHIDTATILGINTILLKSPQTLIDVFHDTEVI
jgi:putative hydrolase of the HAD superfamily